MGRMGDRPEPPTPLRCLHIRGDMTLLDHMFLSYGCSDTRDCLQIFRSDLVVLISWLAWFRSVEVISLEEYDIRMIVPNDLPCVGLLLAL